MAHPTSLRSLPSSLLSLSTLATLLLTYPSPASAGFDCADVGAQKQHFNFKSLGGPYVVHWEEEDLFHQEQHKYNFTIDICNTLKWHKGGSLKTECHHGTQICAIRDTTALDGLGNSTIHPIEIAGTYASHNGRDIDAQFELLRNSKSHSDAEREGVRAELHGGRYPFDEKVSKGGMDQRAIIEFVCDKERSGLEGDEKDDGDKDDGDGKDGDEKSDDGKDKDGDKKDGDKKDGKLRRRDDEKNDKDNGQCEDTDRSLRFCGYKVEKGAKDQEVQTLRLEWRTKYACEDAPADDSNSSSHWGFFTWFIIIFFLAIATYLIFGSWLNYNRYGARGWDLLPHGDTIRDVPYLMKDFARKIKDTVQGAGSRGGYAAV